jgi:hypothetical protein
VPLLDPVRPDIELLRLPRTDSGLPDVRDGDVLGVVRAAALPVTGPVAELDGDTAGPPSAGAAMPQRLQNPSS